MPQLRAHSVSLTVGRIDGQVAAKPYALLRRALERSDRLPGAKFSWPNRERPGLPRVQSGAIMLQAMRWPDEIRSPEPLTPTPVELEEGESEQAVQLADSMTVEDLPEFRDEYRDALEALIAAKAEGKALPEPAGAGAGAGDSGTVVDLMAALNASVAAAKEGRGEESDEHATVHEMRHRKVTTATKATPAKKTTSKKTSTSKKTAEGKKTSTTRKTTAKKSSAS
ncbi:Ku protein [Streptomyces sp. NBC_00654]|uniref:Ku protein n=1 Tax=Streptomyces sp. NBC_00654 TaxID=2975799 RepID=UPI002B1E4D92|nr:Ku protein [Streptomyces sp. NBC_00654]